MIDMAGARYARTRVKICGLTNLEDAQDAVAAGADLLGFLFYPKSPRYVDPTEVALIVDALKSAPASPLPAARFPQFVGVFVNSSLQEVTKTLDDCGLDLAQLHGEEDPEMLACLAGRAFKALRPRKSEEAEADSCRYARLGPENGPDLLVDAYHPGLRGGAGQTGDWELAAGLARRYRLLLAGGLTPENVTKAIRQVQPWGVDVASGVEARPGRKDRAKMRAFVEKVKIVCASD